MIMERLWSLQYFGPTKKGKIYVGSYEENPLKIHRPSFNIELKAASLWAAFKISL